MRTAQVLAMSLFFVASAGAQQSKPLYLFGGIGHKEFLGCINCGQTHPKSVWNEMSRFGFRNDYGVWNQFGQFASQFSSYSICNQFANDPPIIVDDEGNSYGRMSINEFASGSVCSAMGNERACRVAKSICEDKS